ncbi:nuclear transport factor 2 family protein [Rhizobium sp. TRM95111]|uniref:YybH family protein n=1 Tax=Rhizobium alarense TaxID=2846851 RepID=UPI001F4922B7|nr:nuclear transport factor 2 family protein [Rhizobium alarense]MCF3640570.1 nuclear transport factor 2 family protein [Rhizobium alarense]
MNVRTLPTVEAAVLAAADRLVDAFARNDRNAYFAAFATDATFVFHNIDRRLESRAEYENEWDGWVERDGFRVLSCCSSERRVQIAGSAAIFTHTVDTRLELQGETLSNRERETIVFVAAGEAGWIAVHEHLSAM